MMLYLGWTISAAMAPAAAVVTTALAPAVAAVAPVVSAVAGVSTTALVSAVAVGATVGAMVGTAIGKTAAFVKNKLSPNKTSNAVLSMAEVVAVKGKSNSAELPKAEEFLNPMQQNAQPTKANSVINNPMVMDMMKKTQVEIGSSGSFSPSATGVGQGQGVNQGGVQNRF